MGEIPLMMDRAKLDACVAKADALRSTMSIRDAAWKVYKALRDRGVAEFVEGSTWMQIQLFFPETNRDEQSKIADLVRQRMNASDFKPRTSL